MLREPWVIGHLPEMHLGPRDALLNHRSPNASNEADLDAIDHRSCRAADAEDRAGIGYRICMTFAEFEEMIGLCVCCESDPAFARGVRSALDACRNRDEDR